MNDTFEIYSKLFTLQKESPSRRQGSEADFSTSEKAGSEEVKIVCDELSKNVKGKIFKCSTCEALLSSKFALVRHQMTHDHRMFKCKICDRVYRNKISFMKHTAVVHEERIPNLCPHCGKKFQSVSGLQLHCKQYHENKFKFQCSICKATFMTKLHYEGHMNKHNNVKPEQCQMCGKLFSYKFSLLRHQGKCKKVEGKGCGESKLLSCELCKVSFSSSSALKEHQNGVHKGRMYLCPCGSVFKWRSSLLNHRKRCTAGLMSE